MEEIPNSRSKLKHRRLKTRQTCEAMSSRGESISRNNVQEDIIAFQFQGSLEDL